MKCISIKVHSLAAGVDNVLYLGAPAGDIILQTVRGGRKGLQLR